MVDAELGKEGVALGTKRNVDAVARILLKSRWRSAVEGGGIGTRMA